MWLNSDSCEPLILSNWSPDCQGSPSFQFKSKMQRTTKALRIWNKQTFGNVFAQMKECQEKITELMEMPISEATQKEIREWKMKLEEALENEAQYWEQHARMKWKLEGNRNTRFYHISATVRRKRNYVDRIMNDDGKWVNGREE
ncbi:hypothetical protein FRX31_019527, partial [Thalictrum thalictroides]